MSIARPRLLVVVLLAGSIAPTHSRAQSPPADDRVELTAVQQEQPEFYVAAQLNHPSGQYRLDEELSLKVISEEDAYLYVQYQQADGQTFQIFPNSSQPDNRVSAKKAVQIPAASDTFRWTIGPPFGKESIKVIASRKPLKPLEEKSLRAERFNPLSPEAWKGAVLEIDEAPVHDWAEFALDVHTAEHVNDLPGGRRLGVFFGVSKYQISPILTAVTGDARGLDLSSPKNDADKMASVMRSAGRLDDLRLFTNNQATMGNLRAAVTDWLPTNSRPGDTVFIYFSGHGGQIDDDGDEETDDLDEYLLPYDFVDALDVRAMTELQRRGKLPAGWGPYLADMQKLRQKFRNDDAAFNQHLVRTTGLSDDLMGRWLQNLQGREIVVILDICFSGGFATDEKSLKSAPTGEFDFLEQELGRLKDLGQGNEALLAASRGDEPSQVRVDKEYSVMTKALLDTIEESTTTVTLDDGYSACLRLVQEYFDALNRILREQGRPEFKIHHPILLNQCRTMPVIRP